MRSYYHYYDVYFTKDAAVFDREFTADDYEVIEGLDDVTSNELQLIIKVIEYVRPDIERVRVLYNVYEHDDDVGDDVCLTCDSILDVVRDNEGKFVLNS